MIYYICNGLGQSWKASNSWGQQGTAGYSRGQQGIVGGQGKAIFQTLQENGNKHMRTECNTL